MEEKKWPPSVNGRSRLNINPGCVDTPALRPLPHPRRARLRGAPTGSAGTPAPTAPLAGAGLRGGRRGAAGTRGSCWGAARPELLSGARTGAEIS